MENLNYTHMFTCNDRFYLDGEPFQIISGSIHYFRTVPEYWYDRLLKLKEMGCNTVETYVAWNIHEAEQGKFDFTGLADIGRFLKTAAELGLYAIVRPSPYICAEWEFGGLPGWLLKDANLRVRTSTPEFLKAVEPFYDRLFEILSPLQINYGGPIILMQVENEYGSYGTDGDYLDKLKNMMRERGVVVPLITSDGPTDECLSCGTVEGAHPTANFGSRTRERFDVLKKYTAGGPLMCTEFWCGWFDYWGNGGHATGNLKQSAEDLAEMLKLGNVNFYMFEGGTNFGFMNGSNYYDRLTPDVTSYDYDAILTEDGQITEKYRTYQRIIQEHLAETGKDTEEVRAVSEEVIHLAPARKAYGMLPVQAKVNLFDILPEISRPYESPVPVSMERLGQNYGYILYRAPLEREQSIESIRFEGAYDRAIVFVNREQKAVYYDRELIGEHELKVEFEPDKAANDTESGLEKTEDCWKMEDREKTKDCGKTDVCEKAEDCGEADSCEKAEVCDRKVPTLDILVENMGRVNYGPMMDKQRKGIDGGVLLNGHFHHGWEIWPLSLDDISKVVFPETEDVAGQKKKACGDPADKSAVEEAEGIADIKRIESTSRRRESSDDGRKTTEKSEPAFYRFEFDIDEPGDTFLDFAGFGKGCAWVNGFHIGRFWEIGPQKRLYIPAPLIRKGKNTIVLFETDGKAADFIELKDEPNLG